MKAFPVWLAPMCIWRPNRWRNAEQMHRYTDTSLYFQYDSSLSNNSLQYTSKLHYRKYIGDEKCPAHVLFIILSWLMVLGWLFSILILLRIKRTEYELLWPLVLVKIHFQPLLHLSAWINFLFSFAYVRNETHTLYSIERSTLISITLLEQCT